MLALNPLFYWPHLTNTITVVSTVSPEGSVGVSPVNLVYYTEDNVTFLCSFLGGLNNTIQWSKDGLNVNGETEREIVLTTIDAGDGGMYTCTVSNSAGRENASTTLFVAPYFIEHPVDVLSENGANVNFSCLAEAFPMPSYAWKRAEEEEIRTEAIGLNSSLLVYASVLFGDEGVYHCEATILNVTVPSDNATLTCKVYILYVRTLSLRAIRAAFKILGQGEIGKYLGGGGDLR